MATMRNIIKIQRQQLVSGMQLPIEIWAACLSTVRPADATDCGHLRPAAMQQLGAKRARPEGRQVDHLGVGKYPRRGFVVFVCEHKRPTTEWVNGGIADLL